MKQLLCAYLVTLSVYAFSQQDSSLSATDSLDPSTYLPVFSGSSDEGEAGPEQQELSSLLQSSRDVFTQFAGFQFSMARYRLRGLPARFTPVAVNGVIMNNAESGMAAWSAWGGLSDVMRFPETRSTLSASRSFFSGPTGFVNFESRAALFKKGKRISYSLGNRAYHQRLLLSVFSGLRSDGWSFAASASVRYGENVFIKGTYFKGASFYVSAEKKLSLRQTLAFTAFYSPLQQGRAAASTQEVYDLKHDVYYNSNWGYQNGQIRNASVSRQNKPVFQVLHDWEVNDRMRWTTSVTGSIGKSAMSGLTWNDADNPDPDYYQYLPSYYEQQLETDQANVLSEAWKNDARVSEINWDHLIRVNQANLYTPPNLLGQGLNTSESLARYAVEQRVEKTQQAVLNSLFSIRKDRQFFSFGIRAEVFQNRHFKQMEDLLGASYWLDVDQFAEGLGIDPYITLNDLDNPNKKIKVGDEFGYNYVLHINKAQGFLNWEYSGKQFDSYVSAELMGTSIQREGLMANGKFPNESKGKSARINFINPQLKAGLIYKINGRHFLNLQALVGTKAPDVSNVFVSARTRNQIIEQPNSEFINSAELSYHVRYPTLRGRLSLYHLQVNNQTWLRSYWNDAYNTMVNLIMRQMNQQFDGIELGVERIYKVSHVFQYALGYGSWRYVNRPTLEAWQDNTATALYKDRVTYLKNFRVGGTPQLVSGLSYRYNSRRYWFAGLSANYAGAFYVEPNPDRRTAEAVGKYTDAEQDLAAQITQQEQLPSIFYVNVNAGKSYRLKHKYNLNVGLSINNVLNKKSPVSAFESLRWDQTNVNKFPTKYTYMQGLNAMLNVSLSF